TKRSVPITHRANDIISSVAIDERSGNPWVIYRSGTVEEINARDFRVMYSNSELLRPHVSEFLDFNVRVDHDGDVWIFVANANMGVYYLDAKDRSIRKISKQSPGHLRLNSDIVRNLAIGRNGLIWIGTDHGGVNLIDKRNWTIRYLLNVPGDNSSLSQNSINTLYIDHEDILWVGTFKKGINYYHQNLTKFRLLRHRDTPGNTSLPYDDVNALAEDDKGGIWIGTNGGGLIHYDRQANTFT